MKSEKAIVISMASAMSSEPPSQEIPPCSPSLVLMLAYAWSNWRSTLNMLPRGELIFKTREPSSCHTDFPFYNIFPGWLFPLFFHRKNCLYTLPMIRGFCLIFTKQDIDRLIAEEYERVSRTEKRKMKRMMLKKVNKDQQGKQYYLLSQYSVGSRKIN